MIARTPENLIFENVEYFLLSHQQCSSGWHHGAHQGALMK